MLSPGDDPERVGGGANVCLEFQQRGQEGRDLLVGDGRLRLERSSELVQDSEDALAASEPRRTQCRLRALRDLEEGRLERLGQCRGEGLLGAGPQRAHGAQRIGHSLLPPRLTHLVQQGDGGSTAFQQVGQESEVGHSTGTIRDACHRAHRPQLLVELADVPARVADSDDVDDAGVDLAEGPRA